MKGKASRDDGISVEGWKDDRMISGLWMDGCRSVLMGQGQLVVGRHKGTRVVKSLSGEAVPSCTSGLNFLNRRGFWRKVTKTKLRGKGAAKVSLITLCAEIGWRSLPSSIVKILTRWETLKFSIRGASGVRYDTLAMCLLLLSHLNSCVGPSACWCKQANATKAILSLQSSSASQKCLY